MAARTVVTTMNYEPTPPNAKCDSNNQVRHSNAIRLKNVKLDPARALEPARKKLSTIESQRIMSVFEDSIKRIEIVTALPYILKNFDRFRISLGVDLSDLIKQHYRIQGTYQEMRTYLDTLLMKRAKQVEYLESKLIAATTPEFEEYVEPEVEQKKSCSLFDDNDSEFEDDHEEGGDEEETVVDEKLQEEEGEKMIEETAISEEEKAQAVSPEEVQESEARTDIKTASNSGADILVDTLQKEVAENINQMIKHSSHSDQTEMELVDYEPRIEEAMRNLGLVAQQVSHSCKNVLRLFMLNPTAMAILNCEESMRNEGGQGIINSMMELRDILLQKLLTTPEEEAERTTYLEDVLKRERFNQAVIERLERELDEATAEKEDEIHRNNDIIKRLQTDLHQIEKFSDESIRRTRAEAEKQEISDAKNSDQKVQRLQAEIDTLQSQLNSTLSEHREVEADLRAKKYKVENEVDNWIQKYDQDLGERQDEYEEIDLIYTEEKKQLLELEERFAALEKEYLAIMEERRLAREKRDRAQRQLNMVIKAATTIQAFWRSYKVRKALAKKKKKKGGKKGKGKKGKGKKK